MKSSGILEAVAAAMEVAVMIVSVPAVQTMLTELKSEGLINTKIIIWMLPVIDEKANRRRRGKKPLLTSTLTL